MDGARPGGSHTYSYLTGEFGMRACHEGGHFLVSRLDEIYFAFCAVERSHYSIDPVTRVAEDAFDTPRRQSLYDKIADCLTHIDRISHRHAKDVPPGR